MNPLPDDTYRCVMDPPPPQHVYNSHTYSVVTYASEHLGMSAIRLLLNIFTRFRLNRTSRKRRRKRLRQWDKLQGPWFDQYIDSQNDRNDVIKPDPSIGRWPKIQP